MNIENIVKILLLGMLLGLAYFLYETIMEPIRWAEQKEKHHERVIERLQKIQASQLAHRREYGDYASDWDRLINFIKEDSITIVTTIGDPDRPDAEVRKDTQYVKVRDSLFKDDYPIDSIPYVPGSEKGARFELRTDRITRGGIEVPVFRVRDTDPFDKEDVLEVGSLEEPSTSGNW